ncbi:MAG: hypothetical protein VKJ02_19745 [Snowella sp.]|nr:hypothetical protein [Snowella sp.]
MFKSLILSGSLILLGLQSVAFKAEASSPQAWEKHNQEVIKKCTQASELKEAKPVGKSILFGDNVGYDGLIIKGRYPQAHMKNKETQVLCLFNRKTRKAYIGEMQ